MEKIRTFVAIFPPVKIRRLLSQLANRLAESEADVKWVSEENFHITLKFLGGVEPDSLKCIYEVVHMVTQSINSFEVHLSKIGAFPNIRCPRVIWTGITAGTSELKALADLLECHLERIGFPRENRSFSPHMTLGRVKSPRNASKLSQALEQVRDEDFGDFEVNLVSVMKSDLKPAGPIYTPMVEFPLENPKGV